LSALLIRYTRACYYINVWDRGTLDSWMDDSNVLERALREETASSVFGLE